MCIPAYVFCGNRMAPPKELDSKKAGPHQSPAFAFLL